MAIIFHRTLLILLIARANSQALLDLSAAAGDVYGVVGGDDLSMFRKVGSGECLAPASRPVRGRARRDMTHLACRQLCKSTCLGYTYAPCESVCTLHGDPAKIANTSDADGWTTVNGGGTILVSAQRCGANCYQRMAPCSGGNIVSNTAEMSHGPLPYGGTELLTCPWPYVGSLRVRCGLYGVFLEVGRCKSACSGGVVITGNFDVPYPQILHGQLYEAPCPQGASGIVVLTCLDGAATWEYGNCGYDCVLGSLTAGDAVLTYPALNHTQEMNFTCPSGTTGNVTLKCDDAFTKVAHGMCEYDCPAGNLSLDVDGTTGMIFYGDFISGEENDTSCEPENNFTGDLTIQCYRGKVNITVGRCYRHCLPSKVGPGVKAVPHGRMEHLEEKTLQCEPGFVGDIRVRCNDSFVTILSGECMMDCVASSVDSNGVNVPHGPMNHSGHAEVMCPWPTYTGNLSLTCNDGAVGYTGECGRNCGSGYVESKGAIVWYTFIQHLVQVNITCPYPWVGYLTLGCYDDDARWISGWCGRVCPSGSTVSNGASVYYPIMNHSQTKYFSCQALFNTGLTFSGGISIECWDGTALARGQCQADCPGGTMQHDGSTIYFTRMAHGESVLAVCGPGTPDDPLFGRVTVTCNRGYTSVTAGTCGQPCLAAGFFGPATMDAVVNHPNIPHRDSRWVICPTELSGHVELYCENGAVSAIGNGTCGQRCPSQYLDLYGAIITSPLMEHRGKLTPACNKAGFSGHILLQCDFGFLNATSLCAYECPIGNTTITNGIVVDHPRMADGEFHARACPSAGVGDMVLKCVNGVVILYSGGCYKHCVAGWFYDPTRLPKLDSWSVSHYEILHNKTVEATCPQYYDGTIVLHCWNGLVTDILGRCSTNCRPTRTLIRPGVVVMNREMVTGSMTNTMPCPVGFTGNMRLLCTEGVISLGEGGCNSTCAPGVIDTAPHGELFHGDLVEIACPDTGTLLVSCFDGTTTHESGKCFLGCPAGKITDENGTQIEHSYIRHNESQPGACIGLAQGNVNLFCNDTVVTQRRLPGEQCLRSCVSKPVLVPGAIFFLSLGGTTTTTLNINALVIPPITAHGNQATTRCPRICGVGETQGTNGCMYDPSLLSFSRTDLRGLVTMRCFDTDWQVVDGECGDMNCAPGVLSSNGASFSHPEINNGWTAGPAVCPSPYEGIATFACNEGVATIDEVTMQLPVSPRDFEAIAIGNESSDDSRFVICGCCFPEPPPIDNVVVVENDAGVYIWVVAMAGTLTVTVVGVAGWYFMPKNKVSRVWPEETSIAVFQEPRAVKQSPVDPLQYNFAKLLYTNPELAYCSEQLKALPEKQQQLMIKAMQDDPKVINNFFSRRSITYITATEQSKAALAIQNEPQSRNSLNKLTINDANEPQSRNSLNKLAINDAPPEEGLINTMPQIEDRLRSTAQDVEILAPHTELTIDPLPNNEIVENNEIVVSQLDDVTAPISPKQNDSF